MTHDYLTSDAFKRKFSAISDLRNDHVFINPSLFQKQSDVQKKIEQ